MLCCCQCVAVFYVAGLGGFRIDGVTIIVPSHGADFADSDSSPQLTADF